MKMVRSVAVGWLANALVLLIVTLILSDVEHDGVRALLVAAAVFGILNAVVRPFLTFVTIPLAIITLGLIRFAIAMAMLGLTSLIVSGFTIDGIGTLFIATIVVWIVDQLVDSGLRMFDKRQSGQAAGA